MIQGEKRAKQQKCHHNTFDTIWVVFAQRNESNQPQQLLTDGFNVGRLACLCRKTFGLARQRLEAGWHSAVAADNVVGAVADGGNFLADSAGRVRLADSVAGAGARRGRKFPFRTHRAQLAAIAIGVGAGRTGGDAAILPKIELAATRRAATNGAAGAGQAAGITGFAAIKSGIAVLAVRTVVDTRAAATADLVQTQHIAAWTGGAVVQRGAHAGGTGGAAECAARIGRLRAGAQQKFVGGAVFGRCASAALAIVADSRCHS